MPLSDLAHYDYHLPRELIAQQPLPQRSDARLLLVDRASQTIEHYHVRDLPDLLDAKDSLVLNDTRVIPARLIGRRVRTGGRWQGLFLDRDETGLWRMLCKTRGRIEPGEIVMLEDRSHNDAIELQLVAKLGQGQWVVQVKSEQPVFDILEKIGRVPLPPYIRGGEMADRDRESYQTVYAQQPGAVAAPTAGLHFTTSLLQQIEKLGVQLSKVTLHVGPGTFRPIATEQLDEHEMHSEWGFIDAETAEQLQERKAAGGRTIAVGTTSVRVLETAAAATGQLQAWTGDTKLFIRPPYEFKVVDTLLTNFHLPKSTLLVLVRTFGGDELIRRAYEEAIEQRYRFYSYGDAMLIV